MVGFRLSYVIYRIISIFLTRGVYFLYPRQQVNWQPEILPTRLIYCLLSVEENEYMYK